jgi:DNA-binding IscR family transcriptional regulator
MSEVLRALEGPIAPMFCATEDAEHATVCGRTASCTVNLLWVRVRDAIAGALDTMTLADLVPPRVAPPAPTAASRPTSPDQSGAETRS